MGFQVPVRFVVGLPHAIEVRPTIGSLSRTRCLALACGTHSVRFRPTLTVTDLVIQKGIEVLDSAIKDVL